MRDPYLADVEALYYTIHVVRNIWPLALGLLAIVWVLCKSQSRLFKLENERKDR
jgi:hypothetical protein